jgi:hypothetical protein
MAAAALSLDKLPLDPDEYKAKWPVQYTAVFGVGPGPTKAAGGETDWLARVSTIPCRVTRTGCTQIGAARTSASNKCQIALSAYADVLRSSRSNPEIDITYLSAPQRHPQPPLLQLTGFQQPAPQPLLALPAPDRAELDQQHQQHQQQHGSQDSSSQCSSQLPALHGSQAEQDKVAKMVEAMREQLCKARHEPKRDDAEDGSIPGKCCTAVAVRKRPAAASNLRTKRHATAVVPFRLGCSKCRMSLGGCKQCRNPDFKGKRASP